MVSGWRSGGLGSKVGGGEIGKSDVAGVTEVVICEACQRVMRRPAWKEQRSPLGSDGD